MTSQQDTNDYARKDQSAGIDAAFGTGGGQVGASYNQSKIDSTYTSVKEQTGIQAGEGGFDIRVGGHTQLNGAAIASAADPSRNRLETGSLGWSDLENEAEYKASSFGISASGGSGGGSVSPNISVPQHDKASSTTQAGIADGTLIVHDGSGEGIARGVTELQQDGLKEIFDQQKVAERMEMGQVAGQVGMRAAGDLADTLRDRARAEWADATASGDPAAIEAARNQADLWAEGGTGRALLHGVTGAAIAALGGGDALEGLAGAAASQLASKAMLEYLRGHEINPNSPEGKTLMELGSLAVGAAIGSGSGAASALAGEQFNRQLHPDELKLISGELAEKYADETGLSVEEAERRLVDQALRDVDDGWAKKLGGDDEKTREWLAANTPDWAKGYGYFQATSSERADPTIHGEYYDAAYHRSFGSYVDGIVSAIFGDDERSPAEDGALVNRGGYDFVINQLRDQAKIEALQRKPGSEWTNADVQAYANLVTLYPLMRMGVAGGPVSQIGMAIRDRDLGDAVWAAVGVVPAEGVAAGIVKNGRAADEAAALARIAENSIGPVLEGKAVGTVAFQQQARKFDELAGLFDKNISNGSVVIGGQTVQTVPVGALGGVT